MIASPRSSNSAASLHGAGADAPSELASVLSSRAASHSPGSESYNTNSAALEAFAREHDHLAHGKGPAVRMSSTNRDESFLSAIVGASGERILIVVAPKRPDGTLVDIQPGQRWVFRTIHHTTALRFDGVIKSVISDAEPHVYVELSGAIERRVIRKAARVAVAMRATLLPNLAHALIVDLSVGGARFAIDASLRLEVGQSLVCSTALNVADRLYALELRGAVLKQDPPDPQHPQVAIHRMRFEALSDLAFLALQAYVSTELVEELDYFWRLVADPLR